MSALMMGHNESYSVENVSPSRSRQPTDVHVLQGGKLELRGKFFRHRNLKTAHLSQHHIDSMSTHLFETPIDYLRSTVTDFSESDVRAHLGRFGLSGGVVLQPIGSISGGQKARLALAKVCLCHPHVIFLDEPTNNLSIDASEALAEACVDFEGALVVVSHNQWFLEKVCHQLIVVHNGSATKTSSVLSSKPKGKVEASTKKTQTSSVAIIGEDSFQDILRSYLSQFKSV